MRRQIPVPLQLLTFGFACWACLAFGFSFSLHPHFEPPLIWPITAILLSVFYTAPYRRWPLFICTSAVAWCLATSSLHVRNNGGWFVFWLIDNVTIGLSAWVLRRLRTHFGKYTTNETIVYLAISAFLQPALTAFAVTWNASRLDYETFSLQNWQFHFSAMAVSLLVIAPFLVTWAELFRANGLTRTLKTFAHDLLYVVPIMVFVYAFLGSTSLPPEWRHAIIVVPVMTWISFRGRVELSSFANFGLGFALIHLTLLHRTYYFATEAKPLSIVVGIQIFICSNTILQLLLTSAVRQRNAAEAALKEANLAKTKFVAHLSHEIRAPLSAVVGYVDLAQDAPAEKLLEYLSDARRNAEHLEQLINNVLDLSKIEASRLAVERAACDLPELLETCRSMLRAKAETKNLLFLIESVGIPRFIETDALRLKQILINALTNAIKFTPSGSVTLHVHLLGELLNFDVVDTGIGLAEGEHNKLFRDFVQANDGVARRYGGTGLGLSLSKQLARLLEGDFVLLSSAKGKGSTFRLSIPARIVESARVAKTTRRTDSARVLIVDDSADSCEIVAAFTRHAGGQPQCTTSAEDAIRILKSSSFDIVFLDYEMPGMTGAEILRSLRSDGYVGRVVAMTGHDRDHAGLFEFDEILVKPISRAALSRFLSAAKPGNTESPEQPATPAT